MRIVKDGFDVSIHDFRYQAEQDVNRQTFAVKIARVVGFFAEVETIAGGKAVDQFVVFDVDFIDAFFDHFLMSVSDTGFDLFRLIAERLMLLLTRSPEMLTMMRLTRSLAICSAASTASQTE